MLSSSLSPLRSFPCYYSFTQHNENESSGISCHGPRHLEVCFFSQTAAYVIQGKDQSEFVYELEALCPHFVRALCPYRDG